MALTSEARPISICPPCPWCSVYHDALMSVSCVLEIWFPSLGLEAEPEAWGRQGLPQGHRLTFLLPAMLKNRTMASGSGDLDLPLCWTTPCPFSQLLSGDPKPS